MAILEPARVRPCRITTLHLTDAVLGVVAAGLGVSAVATWVAAPAVQKGDLVTRPIAGADMHRSWLAAYRRRDSRREVLTSLVEAIREGSLREISRS